MRRASDNVVRGRVVAMELLADKNNYGDYSLISPVKRADYCPRCEWQHQCCTHPAAHSEDMSPFLPEQILFAGVVFQGVGLM